MKKEESIGVRMDGTKIKVSAEDLLCLRELKVVAVHFQNVQELTRYATTPQLQGLEKYLLIVGNKQDNELKINGKEVFICANFEPLVSGDQLVLPTNIDLFQLDGFNNLTSLSAIPSLKDARDLRKCDVSFCNGLESIFSSSSFSENGQITLQTVETFMLSMLPRFRVLFDRVAPPHNISFNLKKLFFWSCHIMKNIFPVQFLQNFPNLETLQVWECENVIVAKCQMVRRLPLSLHMDSQQAIAPPCLMSIAGDEQWWESLEWEDPLTKTILQPFLNRGLPEEYDDDYLFEESEDSVFLGN